MRLKWTSAPDGPTTAMFMNQLFCLASASASTSPCLSMSSEISGPEGGGGGGAAAGGCWAKAAALSATAARAATDIDKTPRIEKLLPNWMIAVPGSGAITRHARFQRATLARLPPRASYRAPHGPSIRLGRSRTALGCRGESMLQAQLGHAGFAAVAPVATRAPEH